MIAESVLQMQGSSGQGHRAMSELYWNHIGQLEGAYLRCLRTKEGPSNYSTITTIGRGATGEVNLVRRNQNEKVYALKRLCIPASVSKQQVFDNRSMRDMLAERDSDLIVKLYRSFQDETSLYLLTEFLPGGDLATLLLQFRTFSEAATCFYIAETAMAIDAVHSRGPVHRGIKPDSILLDARGHVKLADFGLSVGFGNNWHYDYYNELLRHDEHPIDQPHYLRRIPASPGAGNPNYTAPELILSASYSYEAD